MTCAEFRLLRRAHAPNFEVNHCKQRNFCVASALSARAVRRNRTPGMDVRVTALKPIDDADGHRSLGTDRLAQIAWRRSLGTDRLAQIAWHGSLGWGVRAKSGIARADEVTE